jgi:protein-tyrosine kinase
MSIIEQAVKRLEELRRTGVELPVPQPPPQSASPTPTRAEPPPRVEPETVVQLAQRRAEAPPREAPVARRSPEVAINLQRLATMGYVTPTEPRSQLAEELRVIKRPLLANAMGRSATTVDRGNLIMVTSALPGEGKTFTSVNLAFSIAMELDYTVLLVDADVARPAVLNRLGLPSRKGLLDLLAEPDLDLSDVLLRTNVDKLTILPAGTRHERATELLASDGMSRLMLDLKDRYSDRVIIFDAPPLLASTESRVLATSMGQIVVVVEAQRTQEVVVSQAIAALEKCPVVMTVLNKVVGSDLGSYYGYYANAPS